MMRNSKRKKDLDQKRRGKTTPKEVEKYQELPTKQLTELLKEDNPQKRTIAATVLGNRKALEGIKPLCSALRTEKALYSRIAMSESLGKMGEPAVLPLTKLLGQIGNNQEVMLPKKYFNKKSFPLARDMAARTLIKIGKPATPYLIKIVEEKDGFSTQQAIDALGGIAAKTGDKRALSILVYSIENYSGNEITLWKTVRALSGFKYTEEAIDPLIKILNDKYDPAITWEAVRSLGQIGVPTAEVMDVINELKDYNHLEIKKAVENALIMLGDRLI